MKEAKRKLRKLFIFALTCIMLLQSMVVYAGTDGYTEVIDNAGYEIYLTAGETKSDLPFVLVSTSGSYSVTIYIPYIPARYSQELDEVVNGWDALKTSIENASGDEEELKRILKDAIHWDALNNYIDAGGLKKTSMGYNDAREFSNAVSDFKLNVNVTAKKDGQSLISYVVTAYNEDFIPSINIGGGITVKTKEIEPIFVSDKTEPWYGTVSALEEALNQDDFKLMPGSLIYAEGAQKSTSSNLYSSTKYPMLYVEIAEDENVVLSEKYPGASKPACYLLLDSASQSRSVSKSNKTGNNIVINKVPAEYDGKKVAYWEVVSVKGEKEFFENVNGEGMTFRYTTYEGDKNADDPTKWYEKKDYLYERNYFIQLNPVFDTVAAQNPTVSIDGYSVKLMTNPPTNSAGTEKYPDKITKVKDYYKVKVYEEGDENAVEAGTIESGDLSEYDESANRILHEGKYSVFHEAKYTDSDGTVISSGIKCKVIEIKKPELTPPNITLDDSTTPNTVKYEMPATISPTGEGALDTNYSGEINNQKLIRKVTQDPDFNPESLKTPGNMVDFRTEPLESRPGKVYACTALTIGDSMLGDPAKTYYSDFKELSLSYVAYELEPPKIEEQTNTVTLDHGGEISRGLPAVIKYVYCDYLADKYKEFQSDPSKSKQLDGDEACEIYPTSEVSTAASSDGILKTDGISVVYAIATYKETVGGQEYGSYSDISWSYCTKPYTVKPVQIAVDTAKITLASGGYSSALKGYDTSKIYYIITESEALTEEEKNGLISDSHLYKGEFEIDRTTQTGSYIHAIEVVTSQSEPADNISFTSESEIATKQIPEESPEGPPEEPPENPPKEPSEKSVTVTFNPNGGTCAVGSKQVYKGQPYGELPKPENDYYVFLGWFESLEADSKQITGDSIKEDDKDQTLYAHWREPKYNVVFVANDGKDTTSKLENVEYSAKVKLPVGSQYTHKNKKMQFLGWSPDKSASYEKWLGGAEVSQLTKVDGDTVTLYGIWKSNNTTKPKKTGDNDDDEDDDDSDVQLQTVSYQTSQIIENVKTGDNLLYKKFVLLFLLGIALMIFSILDNGIYKIKSHNTD